MSKNPLVYFDNNATTPIASEVFEEMVPFLKELYFNPGAHYSGAAVVKEKIKNARSIIATYLNTEKKSEIVFTSCATESNNFAVRGTLAANPRRNHIITSNVEHPSIKSLFEELLRQGFEVTFLPVDKNGQLSAIDLIDALKPTTALVSLMHANNETGVVFPIEKLSRLVKQTDSEIIFHTDATQSVGKLPINLQENFKYVDLLSFSGHKMHAPKGIGGLYIKKGSKVRPVMIGGHQEKGRRAGTENIASIIALGKAFELLSTYDYQKVVTLRNKIESFAKENFTKVIIQGESSPRLSTTTSMSFYGIEGESMLYAFNEKNIALSTGSACSSGSLAGSHVMKAMGVPLEYAHGTIRISLSPSSTEKEVDIFCSALKEIVPRLREMSPFWTPEN